MVDAQMPRRLCRQLRFVGRIAFCGVVQTHSFDALPSRLSDGERGHRTGIEPATQSYGGVANRWRRRSTAPSKMLAKAFVNGVSGSSRGGDGNDQNCVVCGIRPDRDHRLWAGGSI